MRILATLAGLFLLGGPLPAVADSPPAVKVRVLAPDGTPAAGAKVWVYSYGRTEGGRGPLPSWLTADTNATGGLTVTLPAGMEHAGDYVHVRDAAGRLGGTIIRHYAKAEPISPTVTVRLVETADRPGRVVDPAGKPIPGASVSLVASTPPDDPQRGPGWMTSIRVPVEDQQRFTATADADGRFTLKGMPVGHTLSFKVSAPGVGETGYNAPADGVLLVTHAAVGSVRVTITGVDPARLKGTGWSLGVPGSQGPRATGPGVQPQRWTSGTLDGNPELVIPKVSPGRCQFTLHQTPTIPATPQTVEPFEVKPGAATAVTVRFGPAATVTGRVVAEGNRKPIAGVQLSVQVGTGNEVYGRHLGIVETAADGTFTAHGPAGWYTVGLFAAPDGYTQPIPAPNRQGLVAPAQVALGQAHKFPDAALPEAVPFVGRAVLPGDKPAAGATVEGYARMHEPLRTGADGRFTDKNLLPGDSVSYRLRFGKAVNVPATYVVGKGEGPTAIELSETNAVTLAGRVTDPSGAAVAGAKVALRHMIWGVGRHSQSGTERQLTTATTDADGRFEFAGLWPVDRYTVTVAADGYGQAEVKNLIGAAGQVRQVPPFVLTRATLAVAGVVVGLDGKPVDGATVFGVDGPARMSARSGPDGRFNLSGYFDAPGFVFARKDGYRPVAVPVTPGAKEPVRVTLRSAADPPAPAPVVSGEQTAAERRLFRHLLTKIWDARVENQFGGNAVRYMARLDPATARRWADEEATRTGGKTQWGRLVDEADREEALVAAAREDIDEAISILRKVTGSAGFYEVLRLGRRLLEVDKAKAARLAEEAAVRARQLTLPTKVYALAQAGELAARAGNRAGGEKVVREAVALAEQLPTVGQDQQTMARGMAVARLAPFDWPAAKRLLDQFQAPSEYNRFLAAAAVQLAPTDLPAAKAALGQFRPGNDYYQYEGQARAALAVASAKPAEAVALVEGITDVPHRVEGYAALAAQLATTDKSRAWKLIDAGFDLMEQGDEPFRSYSNYGGRAGFAPMLADAAKQAGHPDLAGVVARTLALRPTGQSGWGSSADARVNQTVSFAAAVAVIDPASARQVLAGVVPPDKLVETAQMKGRDWLFALALIDPDRAVTLIDKRYEQAKTIRGGSRNFALSGMVELASLLSATDRYTELAGWANLLRPVRPQD